MTSQQHPQHKRVKPERLHRLRQRSRKLFFTFHLWAGLIVGIWFVLLGLSGSIMAWSEDLLGVELMHQYPYQRQGAEPMIPPSRAFAAIRAAYPKATEEQLASLSYPSSGFGFYVWSPPAQPNPDPNAYMMVIVDPYSAKVYPPIDYYATTLMGFVYSFHIDLMMGTKGLVSSGIGAFFATLMVLSGLWLWWPRTIKLLRRSLKLKRGVPLRRLLYDIHNVVGVYFSALLLVLAVTTVLMVADNISDRGITSTVNRLAHDSAAADPVVTTTGPQLGIDTLARMAQRAVGDGTISSIAMPTTSTAPLKLGFEENRAGFFNYHTVMLDPHSGAVLAIVHGDEATSGDMTMRWVGALHFGTYGGVWTKTLYSITGLMPLVLFITGAWRWWSKRRAKRKAPRAGGIEKPELATANQELDTLSV